MKAVFIAQSLIGTSLLQMLAPYFREHDVEVQEIYGHGSEFSLSGDQIAAAVREAGFLFVGMREVKMSHPYEVVAVRAAAELQKSIVILAEAPRLWLAASDDGPYFGLTDTVRIGIGAVPPLHVARPLFPDAKFYSFGWEDLRRAAPSLPWLILKILSENEK
ncbi:MAG TPA: hypothetical protein VEA59_01660 [Patescibacteria group bacterium]|nr:hypothetical protein [Patescibacteria group bacterium]